MMETVTIINKSGKVVSTGKHLMSIFREAKAAYDEKKASLRAEHQARIAHRAPKLVQDDTQSVASSRHSHRSHRRAHREGRDRDGVSRPPLTAHNLSLASEGSVASSRKSRSRRSSSHHGDRHRPRSPRVGAYQAPYFEEAGMTQTTLTRRHTDLPTSTPFDPTATQLTYSTLPPPYTSQVTRRRSVPDLHRNDDGIDMNLAYGSLPPDLLPGREEERQVELAANMSKLDALLVEAHCLQHSATAIITNLQSNPEAMAAVALTLAEISSLLTKMSPGILSALKASSPAVFALLASPQFLIAGGVAIGVTVVMFGGYKIIKKIQAGAAERKESKRPEMAMAYDGDLGSIDTWRRGIVGEGVDGDMVSVMESVEGEFITPEAMKRKKERIRERALEERIVEEENASVSGRSERSTRTSKKDKAKPKSVSADEDSHVRRKPVPERTSSRAAPSESGHSMKSSSSSKSRKDKDGKTLVIREKKKTNALKTMFQKNREARESVVSGRSENLIEL